MKTIDRSAAILALTLSAWALAPVPALAADTPSTDAAPTVAVRMDAARKFITEKNWRDAISELRIAVRDEPKNADAHNLLAYSFRKQAKPDLDKAFEHYKIALKLNPKHLGAHEYIGEAYLMAHKPDEAKKHLAELEKICGNKTCEEYEDLAKAIAAYKPKA